MYLLPRLYNEFVGNTNGNTQRIKFGTRRKLYDLQIILLQFARFPNAGDLFYG